MELYIYNQDSNEIAVIICGETNEDCEERAGALNYAQDLFAWSYTKGNELYETTETIYNQ